MNEKRTISNEVYWQDELRQIWKLYHLEDEPQDYPLRWDGAMETSRGMHAGIDK